MSHCEKCNSILETDEKIFCKTCNSDHHHIYDDETIDEFGNETCIFCCKSKPTSQKEVKEVTETKETPVLIKEVNTFQNKIIQTIHDNMKEKRIRINSNNQDGYFEVLHFEDFVDTLFYCDELYQILK